MYSVLPRTAAALAAATLVPGLVAGFTTSAHAGIIGCGGLSPTLVGSDEGERLEGTEGPDVIYGLGGDDTILGLGGDDVLCGGDGADTIEGAAGVDRVYGDAGRDALSGGSEDDVVNGGDENDLLAGDGGSDVLGGGPGTDYLDGGLDDDRMVGGKGIDAVVYVQAVSGVVVDLRSGAGAENGNAADGPVGARDSLRSVEAAFGSRFKDILTGNGNTNYLLPDRGRDIVNGRGGDDFLDVVDGKADDVDCGGGSDRVRFDKRTDTLKACEDKSPGDGEVQRPGARAALASWARAAAR